MKVLISLVCLWSLLMIPAYAENVNLLWDANASIEQVTSYNIYRTDTSGSYLFGSPEGTVAATASPSFVDVFNFVGRTRFYVVTAVNVNGESGASNEVEVNEFGQVIPVTTVPSNPTGLGATVTP